MRRVSAAVAIERIGGTSLAETRCTRALEASDLRAVGIRLRRGGRTVATSSITFQPKTYFSVQWTAYMIFMVLVGGIGTYEGPILGAVLFFTIETLFGASGVTYLIGLGATALLFALLMPRGIWGEIEQRLGLQLLPVGYRLRGGTSDPPPKR